MQKANKKEAMCELIAMLPICSTLFFRIKLCVTKKIKILKAVLPPPQAAYRYVCKGINGLNGG
jgi:hypothetical protein